MSEPIPAWQPPLAEQFVSTDASNVLIHYLGDVFDWHGYVKFLSLAALRETSRDVPLEKLFVEPHVAMRHLPPDALESNPPPPTQALSAALAENPRLVLLGDPGSGKSTVVNWICTALGRGIDGPLAGLLGGPLVPLPFILRELELKRDFAELPDAKKKWDNLLYRFVCRPVASQLHDERRLGVLFEGGLLFKLLQSGQAIVLLDGIDEIGDIKIREALREAIHEGMRRYPRARWVLTSRIVGYDEARFDSIPLEILETEFGEVGWDYDPDEVLPEAIRMRSLSVRPGYPALVKAEFIATNLFYLAPFNDSQVEHFTQLWWAHHESNPHLAGTKPAQFLGALRQSNGARSLARLPHLLTMIALIYRIRAELPDGRALLYSFIADAYLGTLDKERGLEHLRPIPHNVEEMSRWLAAIGWHLQRRRSAGSEDTTESGESEVLLEREELLGILEQVIRPKPSIHPDQPAPTARETAALFLEYAGRRSGLLLPRGEDRYAFLHLSFQEYFAALHLRDQVTDPEWWNENEEDAAGGSSLADLRCYAAAPTWRETLIFLWESVSLISAKLPQRLIAGMFQWKRDPAQWNEFLEPTITKLREQESQALVKTEAQRVLFAGMLSVDPHVELTEDARRALWERCWRYEIAGQNARFEAQGYYKPPSVSIGTVLFSRAACIHQTTCALRESLIDMRPLLLDLRANPGLSDLRPLAGLTGLQYLNLSANPGLSDLSVLAGLTGLQTLYLSANPGLSDLSALAGLTGLQRLSLRANPGLSDLRPLAGLTGLQYLNLSANPGLSDLSVLAGLTDLQRLYLSANPRLSDLRPLAGLTGLKELDLRANPGLSDLSVLAGLSGLQWLSLRANPGLSDLSPLAGLASLQWLYLSANPGLSDLSALAGLTGLQTLYLSANPGLSDLSALAGLTSLQRLYIQNCPQLQPQDVASLKRALPKLRIHQ